MTTLRQRWHHHETVTGANSCTARHLPRPSLRPSRTPHGLGLNPQHLQVLRAISDGRVTRDLQYGDLAPWMLDGQAVSWSVTVLAAHGYIVLTNTGLGPAVLTGLGVDVLNGCD